MDLGGSGTLLGVSRAVPGLSWHSPKNPAPTRHQEAKKWQKCATVVKNRPGTFSAEQGGHDFRDHLWEPLFKFTRTLSCGQLLGNHNKITSNSLQNHFKITPTSPQNHSKLIPKSFKNLPPEVNWKVYEFGKVEEGEIRKVHIFCSI